MNQITVKFCDVLPDPNNPRTEFGDIKALARTFQANSTRPGEPFTPPLLVADGSKYRIVDGERRYRAMKALKITEFLANVASDMDDANTMLAMMATDDKLKLTPKEQSIAVQKALLLGVDPDLTASALRIEREKVYKVSKRVAETQEPENLSIDQLIVSSELKELGLDEAAQEVATAKDWEFVAFRAKKESEFSKKRKKFIEIIESAGIEIGESDYTKHKYLQGNITTQKELKEALKNHKNKEGVFAEISTSEVVSMTYIVKPIVTLWSSKPAKNSGAKDSDKTLANRLKKQFRETRKFRIAFILESIAGWETKLVNVSEFCMQHLSYNLTRDLDKFNEKHETSIAWKSQAAIIVCVLGITDYGMPEAYPNILDIIKQKPTHTQDFPSGCKIYVDYLNALVADGYKQTDEELELFKLCEDCMAAVLEAKQAKELEDATSSAELQPTSTSGETAIAA